MNKFFLHRCLSIAFSVFLSLYSLMAQNCLGIQNLDILNVAKQIDPGKVKYVTSLPGQLIAAPGFKFVQLRDTETFLLVPEDFQGRVVDLLAFLPESGRGGFVLDTGRMTAKLICQTGSDLQRHCKHIRQTKTIVGCMNCSDGTWMSASVLSNIGVIIPPYRLK